MSDPTRSISSRNGETRSDLVAELDPPAAAPRPGILAPSSAGYSDFPPPSSDRHPGSDDRLDVLHPSDAAHPPSMTAGPVDILGLWDSEAGAATPETLAPVRVGSEEVLIVPFTTTAIPVDLHFLDFRSSRGYVRCHGPGCLLCRVGRRPERRDLLPVYDVLGRSVSVLPIGTSLRPHALRPQLAPILRRAMGGERLIVSLRREDYKFLVATLIRGEGVDDGAGTIASFRSRFEAGQVDLAAVYPSLANEELAQVDEVRSLLAAKGIRP